MSTLDTRADLGKLARLTTAGLTLKDGLGFDEWASLGDRIVRMHNASAWAIGDWLFYGYFREWGHLYDDAIEQLNLGYKTLADYRSIAGAFEPSRRVEQLSFGHHTAVAALPEADADMWLAQAAAEGWSRDRLRDEIAASRQLPAKTATQITLEQIRFTIPADRAERWKTAADRAGVGFSEWAAQALDAAAA